VADVRDLVEAGSAGVRSFFSLGGIAASIRPVTLLPLPSKPGKNSPQEISMPAVPWPTDWPSPSQVQVLAAGGMGFTSSSMQFRPARPSASPPENIMSLSRIEPPFAQGQAVQSQIEE
jgi:hypothetical protein